jgi:hypothetical protein
MAKRQLWPFYVGRIAIDVLCVDMHCCAKAKRGSERQRLSTDLQGKGDAGRRGDTLGVARKSIGSNENNSEQPVTRKG